MNREPDAVIKVRFATSAEGGRRGPILNSGTGLYGCPLFVDGEGFDCRFLVRGTVFQLGETYEVPILFLCPKFALPMLSAGKPITLWEGKTIARGEVVRCRRLDDGKMESTP